MLDDIFNGPRDTYDEERWLADYLFLWEEIEGTRSIIAVLEGVILIIRVSVSQEQIYIMTRKNICIGILGRVWAHLNIRLSIVKICI